MCCVVPVKAPAERGGVGVQKGVEEVVPVYLCTCALVQR